MPLRFTVCDVCEHLKGQLHSQDVPLAEKLGAASAYRAHLASQYSDRSVAWQLCDVCNNREGDVLVCWLDGMEQAKFALPRCRGLRTTGSASEPKYVIPFFKCDGWIDVTCIPRAKLQKPRMKLHGCWIFGYCLDLYCIDETSKHDASCMIEILSQSIQRVTCFNCYLLSLWLLVETSVFLSFHGITGLGSMRRIGDATTKSSGGGGISAQNRQEFLMI